MQQHHILQYAHMIIQFKRGLVMAIAIIGLFLFIGSKSPRKKYPDAVEQALQHAGKNREKLEKVIRYFQASPDSLKLKAAYFLIRNGDDQYYFGGPIIKNYDSIITSLDHINYSHLTRVYDSLATHYNNNIPVESDWDLLTSDFLIQNIEESFKAWQRPWCRHLSFEQFCEFILPYKVANERPESWRKPMMARYRWVIDSLKGRQDPKDVCKLINKDLMSWFDIGLGFKYPGAIPSSLLYKCQSGEDCYDAASVALYAMRAMGVPVAMDFTPNWANRSQSHAWNSILCQDGKTISFLGYESHPGMHKIELIGFNRMKFKRAKVYRKTFAKQENALLSITKGKEAIPLLFQDSHFADVTKIYVPVSDVHLNIAEDPISPHAYLCIFDNKNWFPIHWGEIEDRKVVFTDMGRDVVYLPIFYVDNQNLPIGDPFILDKKGNIHILTAIEDRQETIQIFRKYPEDDSNKIVPGDMYEVFYWKKGWISMGTQKAVDNFLVYNNAPAKALFFIRNLDRGKQERIFTIKDGNQVWW